MTYQFDIEIANKYGVDSAILIQNLAFWIKTNASNGRNYNEGRFWTYNSIKAYEKLFPFWTYKTIRRIIENLLKEGVLISGNFNENTYNRTSWYALSDELIEDLQLTSFFGLCICPNGQMELPKQANGIAQMGESYIGTDNKQYIKPDSEGSLAFFETNYPSDFERLMMQYKSKINDFVKFSEMFEATVLQEGLEFKRNVIEGRFIKYARNWITNQAKFESDVIKLNPNGLKEKIGGF